MTAAVRARLAIGMFLLMAAAAASANDQWPRFRGLNSGAVPDNPVLPDTWSEVENVAWKTEIPGIGWGSPIVWDDLIFVTVVIGNDPMPRAGQLRVEEGKYNDYRGASNGDQASERRWLLYAVDFSSGKVRWQRELFKGVPRDKKHPYNSYASETPVTDGKYVYVFHASTGRLFAVDFKGRIAWSREVAPAKLRADIVTKGSVLIDGGKAENDIPGDAIFANSGPGASPALHGDRIFIVADNEPRGWMMAAFATADGRQLWRIDEPKMRQAYGWATPFVWEHSMRTEVITGGDTRIHSFDLDGRPLWEIGGLSLMTTPTPFAAGGLLYVSSGYVGTALRPVFAIRPGASGDISLKEGESSNQHVAWYQRQAASYLPSALVYRDVLYTLYSQGFFTAHDAHTGATVYGRKRIDAGANLFTASPWAYNGRIFAASEDGVTYVMRAGSDYEVVRKNAIDGMIMATPAVVRDSVIIRTATALYRIKKR